MADHGDAEQAKSDDVDERTDHIARVVKDYLREGDAFLIQCQEGEILVEAAPPSNLEKEHPRLYGRLMSLNEQLDTGCMFITVLLAAGGLYATLYHEQFESPPTDGPGQPDHDERADAPAVAGGAGG